MDTDRLQHLADLAGLELDPVEHDGLAADLARLDAWISRLPRLPEDAPSPPGTGPPVDTVSPCPLSDPPAPGALLEVPLPGALPDAEPAP